MPFSATRYPTHFGSYLGYGWSKSLEIFRHHSLECTWLQRTIFCDFDWFFYWSRFLPGTHHSTWQYFKKYWQNDITVSNYALTGVSECQVTFSMTLSVSLATISTMYPSRSQGHKVQGHKYIRSFFLYLGSNIHVSQMHKLLPMPGLWGPSMSGL